MKEWVSLLVQALQMSKGECGCLRMLISPLIPWGKKSSCWLLIFKEPGSACGRVMALGDSATQKLKLLHCIVLTK